MEERAQIGVIGGSGFYSFLENVREIDMDTPYGKPSDKIALGTYAGKTVAFLPRHGKTHSLPPHLVPYRANLYALKMLGVERVIGPNASGSLQPEIKPGDFVVTDQFVDRTTNRPCTFYEGPKVVHLSTADMYCPTLRRLAVACGRELGIPMHESGTMVVIQGPRFSTRAESRWFSAMGWSTVNMTQYPEGYLARELGMCYCNIALITDYDAGLEGRDDILPVTQQEVTRVFNENNEKLRKLLFLMLERMDTSPRTCACMEV